MECLTFRFSEKARKHDIKTGIWFTVRMQFNLITLVFKFYLFVIVFLLVETIL